MDTDSVSEHVLFRAIILSGGGGGGGGGGGARILSIEWCKNNGIGRKQMIQKTSKNTF